MLRKILTTCTKESIQKVLDLNLSTNLIQFMKDKEQTHIQLEAAWCVAQIATGYRAQIQFLVSKGLFPALAIVLSSPHEVIFEQGAWIVANVAAEDYKYKNGMIEAMCHVMLIEKLGKAKEEKVVKYSVWALSNLFRGGEFQYLQMQVSPFFLKILMEQNDVEIISNCLIPVADIMNANLVAIIHKANLMQRFYEISKFKYNTILEPLIQILRHFSSSTDEMYSQLLIDHNFIDKFFEWLNDKDISSNLKREILWILSNITVGSDPQIGSVLKSKQHYDLLLKFCYDEDIKMRKEAIFCLCCVTNKGSFQRKRGLIKNNIFGVMNDNFCYGHSSETICIMLEALGNILGTEKSMGEHYEEVLLKLEDIGVFDNLEKLQRHDSNSVYTMVCGLIENYLGEDDDMMRVTLD